MCENGTINDEFGLEYLMFNSTRWHSAEWKMTGQNVLYVIQNSEN